MKKKILAIVWSVTLVLSLTACSRSTAVVTGEEAEDVTESQSETNGKKNVAPSDASDLKVGLITGIGGLLDGSNSQYAWEGITKAEEAFGITVQYLESAEEADYATFLSEFAKQDYDLVICPEEEMGEVLLEAAKEHPDVQFAQIGDNLETELENVLILASDNMQMSYLGGYAAAKSTSENKVGMITNEAENFSSPYIKDFREGIKRAKKNVQVVEESTDGSGEESAGRSAVESLQLENVDVIFDLSGNPGVVAAGLEKGILVIAPDISVLCQEMCYDAAAAVARKEPESGKRIYSLPKEGDSLQALAGMLDEKIQKKVQKVKKSLLRG